MSARVDAADVAVMLALRIEALVRELLPAGRRDGAEWRVGSVRGEPGQSTAIRLHGSKAGVWSDFSSGDKGDALDLVAKCLFGGDTRQALEWSKGWLGLAQYDETALKKHREEVHAVRDARAKDSDKLVETNRALAKRIWLAGGDRVLDTPMDAYLRGRSIALDALPRLPKALRFSTQCYSSEDKRRHPAMLACVNDMHGDIIAVHRTYLAEIDGQWRKAPLDKAKAVLGSYAGGHISLNRGASCLALAHAPEGDRVILCEGIEDGLTLALALPEYRVLAAISLSNLQNVVLPATIRQVVIAADNDDGNPQAVRALERACDAFIAQGREVRVTRSPVGKDFNDFLRAS